MDNLKKEYMDILYGKKSTSVKRLNLFLKKPKKQAYKPINN